MRTSAAQPTRNFYLMQELVLLACVLFALMLGAASPWFWVILVLAPLWQVGLLVSWLRNRRIASA